MIKRILQNSFAFLFSLILSLWLAEIGVRWFVPQTELQLSGLYSSDPVLGWTLTPGFSGRYSSNEFDINIEINSAGMRDNEQTDQFAGITILAIGDSFFFGSWSNFENTVLTKLERKLQSRYANLRIIKAGVPAFGTGQEAMLLNRLIQRYRPNLVILGLFVGNDVADTLVGPTLYTVRNGMLIWDQTVLQHWWNYDVRTGKEIVGTAKFVDSNSTLSIIQQWLRIHSHLYQLLIKVKAALTTENTSKTFGIEKRREYFWPSPDADLTVFDFETYYLKKYPPLVEDGYRKVFESLNHIANMTASENAKLIVTLIPTREQVYSDRMNERLEVFDLTPNDIEMQKPQNLIAEWATTNKVDLIDLLPGFRSAAKSDTQLYFLADKHWSDNGHSLAASIMSSELEPLIDSLVEEKGSSPISVKKFK